MEGEGTWFKGVFKRLFQKKKKKRPPLTSQQSCSPSGSFLSAIEGDDNASFVRDTPQSQRKATDEGCPSGQSSIHDRPRESRSLSPSKLHSVVGGQRRKCLKSVIKNSIEDSSKGPPTNNAVALDVAGSTDSPSRLGRSRSEERTPAAGGVGSGGSSSVAEQRLMTLIRERGYLVKKHIPRKVLDEKIIANIRRRERIAGHNSVITTADKLAPTFKPVPRIKPPVIAKPAIDPMNLSTVFGLVNKAWIRRDVKDKSTVIKASALVKQEFAEDCLNAHNKYRELHGVSPLTLCDQLTDDAQAWAKHISETNILEFSTIDGRGENIMTSSTSRAKMTGSDVTTAWYEKGRKYNYNMLDTADLAYVSEFTQVIWNATERMGVGMTCGDDGRMVVVVRYFPIGNIPGQIKANVLPPLHVNPFDVNSLSKTREESNLSVQIVLISPEVCEGVAKRLNKKLTGDVDAPKVKIERQKHAMGSKTTAPLIPNGRLGLPMSTCCGPPSGRDVNVTPKARRGSFQVLSPSNLTAANAYQNYRPETRRESYFQNNRDTGHFSSGRYRMSNLMSMSATSSAREEEDRSRTLTVQPTKSSIGSPLAPS